MAECCGRGTKLIYSCSGSADVGEIADHVTRKLRDQGFAEMTCLAGIGAGLPGYVQSAKGADEVITIDGCATACARKSLERIGVVPKSFVLTDMGLEKHETPVTDQIVTDVLDKIQKNVGLSAASPRKTGAAVAIRKTETVIRMEN